MASEVSEPSSAAALSALSVWSRVVLDAAMDAVIVIDRHGLVGYWNPAAARMFGWSWEEVAGRELAELIIPATLRDRHRHALHAAEVGQPASILGRRIEVSGQRRDGSVFPLELTITRTDHGDVALFTGYLRDITERQQLVAELRESRTRMLEVSDRTRRQIERNLHDGAQQQLVGAAMVVAQARDSLAGDPVVAAALLERAGEVLVEAITEIREIARGVLPGVLADHGLGAALAELGRRSPIPVQIETLPERWPDTIETTLYFLAAETLTNAARHGAQTAQLRVHIDAAPAAMPRLEDDNPAVGSRESSVVLVCAVSDDGPGGADASRGSGLQGLRDRVAAAGGTLEIVSPLGGGTTVTARIHVVPDGRGRWPGQRDDR